MSGRSCEVTVIIPTRNRVAFLARALGCALGQADVRCEIRVVDDASSDGTAELLRRCSDGRIKWSRNDVPLGVAAARNIAASEAQGEWLAFLDDDDLWAPTWLRTGLRIGRAQQAGLVYGSRWIVDDQRRVVGTLLAEHPRQLRRTLTNHNSLGGPSAVMVRADVMAAAGGFDPRLSALADWDAWLRILDIGHGAPVSEPLTAYTVHPDNMHLRDPFGMLAEFARFAEIVKARRGEVDAVRDHELTVWLAAAAARAGHRQNAARLWLRSARRTRRPQRVVRAWLALLRDQTEADPLRFAGPEWLEGHQGSARDALNQAPSDAPDRSASRIRLASSAVER